MLHQVGGGGGGKKRLCVFLADNKVPIDQKSVNMTFIYFIIAANHDC
jgi:hypothetical protein